MPFFGLLDRGYGHGGKRKLLGNSLTRSRTPSVLRLARTWHLSKEQLPVKPELPKAGL